MPQQVTMNEARDKMDKCVEAYRQELANIRTELGRERRARVGYISEPPTRRAISCD